MVNPGATMGSVGSDWPLVGRFGELARLRETLADGVFHGAVVAGESGVGKTRLALGLIDELDTDITSCERDLRRLGAVHPYVELLMTAPGIGWVLGYTIAAEIGDIGRFASAKKLTGYTGLCPKADQSGESDWRGPSPRTAPAICAGRSSKPPCTPRNTPATGITTNAPDVAAANSAAPKSPALRSPANSPPRSGTCSPAANPSLRQAPITPWPLDGPLPSWATGASHQPNPRHRAGNREMTTTVHPHSAATTRHATLTPGPSS